MPVWKWIISGIGIGFCIGAVWSHVGSKKPTQYFISKPYGTIYADPSTLPCDYPHPSEFTDDQWREFAKRCR